MKTIGLIGGMSWESSIEYYRIINETVRERLGGFFSAVIVMYSVNFADIVPLQHALDWDAMETHMATAAKLVQQGGADFIVICSCTMNSVADRIHKHIDIPILHIADATAVVIRDQGMRKVGLLGTRFTMEEDYFKGRIAEKYGLEVLVPREDDREIVHRVIYDELVLGRINPASREKYANVINRLTDRGAEGIILGCTEIGLLIDDDASPVPTFDTTYIHAEAAVKHALKHS